MAGFINKKEEVIDISLTQHGKYLISQGKFKPSFYAFYDDDILYDGAHAGVTSGSQNENLTRIKETQRLKINPIFNIMNINDGINHATASCVQNINTVYNSPVGIGDSFKEFVPSWKIQPVLDSEYLSGSVSYSASLGQKDRIPQVDVHIECRYKQNVLQNPEVIQVEEIPRILLSIEEENTIFKNNSNFEIEVYEIENAVQFRNGTDPAVLRRLIFAELGSPDEKMAMDRTFLDPSYYSFARDEEQILDNYPVLNRSHVEHFMSFKVDSQISDLDLVAAPSPLYVPKTYVPPEDCG